MDNPSSESSSSPLDANSAAAAFSSLLGEPVEKQPDDNPDADIERLAAEEVAAESEPESEQQEEGTRYTVKVDGKEVEVSLDELRNGYQRQQDYTRKTMEASETRKAAEAEFNTARSERQQYANQLQGITQQLQGALQEQAQINWTQLLDSDPVEYLKQQHLYQQRQSAYQNAQTEQSRVTQQQQAEQAQYIQNFVQKQHEELLAKLPDWKDESKAKAEKSLLVDNLESRGFNKTEISQITDHRMVLLAREAMKYQQLMSKAKAATQKVAPLPPKVERSGTGTSNKPDARSSAMTRLAKTGRVEDAASVFAQFL